MYFKKDKANRYMTQLQRTLLLILICTMIGLISASAQRSDRLQRKLEEMREQQWPPERGYSRVSLGYALQRIFERHCEYCGFSTPKDRRRDYVPQDISKFLGRRTLRTDVETANIRGGGLLYYIFKEEDLERPFDEIDFSPSRIFQVEGMESQFVVNPDPNFDSYFMHKTCSGYLRAALEAGIEPPYSSFRAALDTDHRRESSVVALSGSFVSPMRFVFEGNDYQTTQSLMQLWRFYQQQPEYIGNAYYLREFEGVMLKHLTSAEQNYRIEREGGFNFAGPLPARLEASLGFGNTGQATFAGTDWETIIYTEFDYDHERLRLFSPLPGPEEIQEYVCGLNPVFQKAQDLPLMIEGIEHKHFLIVEGIPDYMTAGGWEIEEVSPGVYDGTPTLTAEHYFDTESRTGGCRFTVTGRPLASNFRGPIDDRPSKLNVRYRIRSREPVGGKYLYFDIDEEIQTSSHPIANISDGRFDLTKKDGWEFAFQWKFAIEIEDHYNPVSFDKQPYIGNLTVRRSDKKLNVRIVEVEPDAQRKQFYVTLETQETYPLGRIDNSAMQNYNLSLDIHLESARTAVTSVRPLKGILRLPALKELPPPEPVNPEPVPLLETGPSPGGGTPEGN
jgi:hypothetical protein